MKIFINKQKLAISIIGAIIVISAFSGLYFAINYKEGRSKSEATSEKAKVECSTNYPKYHAGVVTNGIECAKIGSNILKMGGSAADAAIAALFCEGVAQPQSMGLGGGFLLTIYNRSTETVETLDARETAPAAATEDMYAKNSTMSQEGGLAVAVPGELRGYWELYKRYGKLEWKELIEPTIDLCKKGIYVTKYLASMLKSNEDVILNEPSLREIFIDPITNKTWTEGERIKRLQLAKTLEIIAKDGADALYGGPLGKLLIEDLQKFGGIITEEDLRNYMPKWSTSLSTTLPGNFILHSSPLPGSGAILIFIMNVLSGFLNTENLLTPQNWQRITESFKFGYGLRTELGDIEGLEEFIKKLTSKEYAAYIKTQIYDSVTFQDPKHYGANYTILEDHGTAHINVLAPNGDAVSVTSTINLILGAKIRSRSTGIIFNDEMDDFSNPRSPNKFNLPPSPANYIKPGKRPLSSMCPSIILDKNGDVRLIVGGAGGSKITTATALVALRNLWFKKSLNDSIVEKRLHHQLFPMKLQYEDDFDMNIVYALTEIGHKPVFTSVSSGFAAVTALAKQCGTVFGNYDIRRQGSVSLF